MILEFYLKKNDSSIKEMQIKTGLSDKDIKEINLSNHNEWTMKNYEALAKTVEKDTGTVIYEIELLNNTLNTNSDFGCYNLENRRYIGNKNKLSDWIYELIDKHTIGDVFFDVFAGTGVISKRMLEKYNKCIINDFLYSNNIIYKAFFGTENYNIEKLLNIKEKFNNITFNVNDSYFEKNFGGKFFSCSDAKIIGEIREQINFIESINERERAILIASLIYSCDKVANTVGHYDAYRKLETIENKFKFNLINPLNYEDKDIKIYKEDANELVRKIKADIAFIDPPYNSRQYSRFYHILENLAKWEKPILSGVAMKPPVENMSDYCRMSAPIVFDDLIQNLNVKYIVVTYNNTYNSKSSSSKNKITHSEILNSLNKVGPTKVFEKPFQFFNAGKTELKNHKEFVFITEVIK